MGAPKVSVLMPVFNGGKYLMEAVDSILGQTFSDFEFIIVNDGSTDNTVEILETYKDPRIRLTENEKNLGLIRSLNRGLDLACGEYIARMDCDDISLPDRFAFQVSFLDNHPGVGVCGTWAKIIDENGKIMGKLKPMSGNAVRKLFWRPSSILHPTCMIRAKLLKDARYSPDYPHAEDYELWLRLYPRTVFFNLDRFLLLYRIHPAGVGRSKRELQLRNSYRAFSEFMVNGKISYEEYLSLIPVEARINPFRRAYCWWLASASTKFDVKLFLVDNLIYTKLWLAKRLH